MKPAFSARVALLLMTLGLGLVPRLWANGFTLPSQNAGLWGQSPAGLVADIETVLRQSGFLNAVDAARDIANKIGQGKVPAIDDLTKVVDGDVQQRVNAAVAQANEATRLLGSLDVAALQTLFERLESTITTPQEFAVSIPGGRLVFRLNLTDVSLFAVIAGPGGALVTLGMSNGSQLCGNPAARFVNPSRQAVLFADFALGYSNLQSRRSLLTLSAVSIEAATYFKIHDDWVQLRLAGNDPGSLKLKLSFVAGFRLGFSAELQGELEGQVLVELEVQPTQVASLLGDITDILKKGLASDQPASVKASPAAVAGVLKQVFAYLQSVKTKGEEFGEISVSMATDAGIGVGIWDTGINLASVGAQINLVLPLEALVGVRGDLLAAQLEAGMTVAAQLESLFEAMSEGRLDAAEMERQLVRFRVTAGDFARSIGSAYLDYLGSTRITYETGLYGLGDIGQAAAQTIPILVLGVDIPVGQMFTNTVNGGADRFASGLTETAKAGARLAEAILQAGRDGADGTSLGGIIRPGGIIKMPTQIPAYVQRPRGTPPQPPTAAEWEAMATELLDDFTFSVRFGALGMEGMSMGSWVRLMGGANAVAGSILAGAVRSAVAFSEKPLVDALRAAPGQVGQEALELLIFNLQKLGLFYDNSLGASGTIGAEVAGGLGGRIAFDARLKASLFLLTLDNKHYDEKDGTLLVGVDIPMEVSASGGIAPGEGLEFTMEGGFTAGASLGSLTLKDWGGALPVPAGLRIAGFEVIDFDGTTHQDGTMTGRGWIMLPMGGLVRADRVSIDAAGRVIQGSWSGVLELGPFGEKSIASGIITDSGLVGRFNLAAGSSTLQTDFLLRSNGLLFGNTAGILELGGFVRANVQLSLSENGSFMGTGTARILGSDFASTDLRVLPDGRVMGSFSGTLDLGHRSLTLSKLEILENKLQGRTTLDIAGLKAVELWITIDEGGVLGTFASNLDILGAGSSHSWVRVTDEIEVFGQMDWDFVEMLEVRLRETLLGGLEDARGTLRREQEQLRRYREEVQRLDGELEKLKKQIQEEQQAVKEAAEGAVRRADAALLAANAELNKAIEAIRGASGTLAAELDKAEAAFGVADGAFALAQGAVNKARGEIDQLDRWYQGLNPVAKAILWAWYQAERGVRLAALAAADRLLSEARNVRNAAEATLRGIQAQLADAQALVAIRDGKDAALTEARAKAEEARRELTRVVETLADPTLDLRYVALSLSREAALRLLAAAERLIAATTSVLSGVTVLVEYLDRNGPSGLVTIQQVNYRSTLADLNNGFIELVIDALVAGQPRRFVFAHHLGAGRNDVDIAAAARLLSPQLYPRTDWTVLPWTDDASSGISPGQTLWAYRFNSAESTRVRAFPVIGLMGTSPAVPGRFAVEGFVAAFTGDQNLLTSGTGGSAAMAAHFLYGAYPGTIRFEGLTPGLSYRATFLSAGWDDAPYARRITFSSASGERTVEQNAYGNNHGIRIDHTFTATANTHTVTLTPASDASFHLYGLALSVEADIPRAYGDWKQIEFGSRANLPGVAGDRDDPDGDGIPNFMEYALRLDPQSAGRSGFSIPVPVVLPGGVQARRFTIPYQPDAGDLVYRIRRSSDLATWTDAHRLDPATGNVTQLPGVTSSIDPVTQTMTVTITDLSLFAPPSFWSLTVDRR